MCYWRLFQILTLAVFLNLIWSPVNASEGVFPSISSCSYREISGKLPLCRGMGFGWNLEGKRMLCAPVLAEGTVVLSSWWSVPYRIPIPYFSDFSSRSSKHWQFESILYSKNPFTCYNYVYSIFKVFLRCYSEFWSWCFLSLNCLSIHSWFCINRLCSCTRWLCCWLERRKA